MLRVSYGMISRQSSRSLKDTKVGFPKLIIESGKRKIAFDIILLLCFKWKCRSMLYSFSLMQQYFFNERRAEFLLN